MTDTIRFTPPVTKDGMEVPSYLGLLVKKFGELSSKRKYPSIENISLSDKQEIYALFIDHYVNAKVLMPAKNRAGYSIDSDAVDYLNVQEAKIFSNSNRLINMSIFPAVVDDTFAVGTLGRQKQLNAIANIFPILSDYTERIGLIDNRWKISIGQKILLNVSIALASVGVIASGLVIFGVMHAAFFGLLLLAVPLGVWGLYYTIAGGNDYEKYLTEEGHNVKEQFTQYETVLKSEVAGSSYVDEYSGSNKRRKIRV